MVEHDDCHYSALFTNFVYCSYNYGQALFFALGYNCVQWSQDFCVIGRGDMRIVGKVATCMASLGMQSHLWILHRTFLRGEISCLGAGFPPTPFRR